MKKFTFTFFVFHCIGLTYGQNPEIKPSYFVGKDSTLYWNKKLPVYIKLAPTPDGNGVNLISKEFEQFTNPVFLDTEGPNYIRTRYAVDKSTGEVKVPKTEVLFEVVSDGSAPTSQISFTKAPVYSSGNKIFYGKGLEFELNANDKYSGVKSIYTMVDEVPIKLFTGSQAVHQEGVHTVRFFALDHVGNTESIQTAVFTVDTSAPSITHNINGVADGNTLAGSSTLYFTTVDPISGVASSSFRFDDQPYSKYTGNKLDLTSLEDGPHTIEYFAEDHVGNKSQTFKFDFYYDKLAPLTASDIIGDKFLYLDKVYFSGRTKMKLTAIDNKIGVKEIKYSIDNGNFLTYEDPFYLPSVQGNHTIKFYSVDRLSNQPSGAEEYKHNINLVFLDLTGPDINHSITGPLFKSANDVFIGPASSIRLVGEDHQSGLQYLSYSIDGALAETKYDKPFQLNTNSGSHKIEMFGYDNVNNRNINQITVLYDANPPKILPNFSVGSVSQVNDLPVYPPHMTLFLAATDEMVGNDKIFFQINSGTEQQYVNPLSQWQKGNLYKIKIRAIDKVGNEATSELSFRIADK
jgi:hypothetical protein